MACIAVRLRGTGAARRLDLRRRTGGEHPVDTLVDALLQRLAPGFGK